MESEVMKNIIRLEVHDSKIRHIVSSNKIVQQKRNMKPKIGYIQGLSPSKSELFGL
jgi:hypothetical protein